MNELLPIASPLLVVLAALLLDQWLGEAPRWHPLVGFGWLVQRWERHTNHGSFVGRFLLGTLGMLVLTLPISGLLWLMELPTPWQWLWEAIVVYVCLGFRSLRDHTTPIAERLQAFQVASLDAQVSADQRAALLQEARARTGWIVSRDTDAMDPQQCARAAIESLLENGNDALFATVFWYLLLGPAGAVLHRLVNTLDAMWGYRNARFEYFGKCAARADDVMAWVPARLTALSYALAGHLHRALRCWRQQANRLKSPNGGPCMTAGAGSLGILLGGPARYHGEWVDKPFFGEGAAPDAKDILRAQALLWRALAYWVIVLSVVTVGMAAR